MTKKSLKIHLKGSMLVLDTLNACDIDILDKTYLGNFKDIKKNYGYHLVQKTQIFHKIAKNSQKSVENERKSSLSVHKYCWCHIEIILPKIVIFT